MNKKRIIIVLTIMFLLIIFGLWFSGFIPKQIAKIYGANYMNNHFPKMKLEYENLEWSKYHNSYIISFKDKENNIYGCTIGPKYFPISLGQGLYSIEETYRENY